MTASGREHAPPTILVLDDEPAMADLVGEVARRAGWAVAIAATASEFLAALERPVQLATIDLMIPGTDGVELLRNVAALPVPPEIVFVSGMDERVIAGAARVAQDLRLAVRGTIRKPFRVADLRHLLDLPGIAPAIPRPAPPESEAGPVVSADDLRRGLVADELRVVYQPQVDVVTRAWVGVEALVRWQHPAHGLLSPAAFLALVTDELLASELTVAVVRRATTEWADLRARTGRDLALSINVHPLALTDPALASLVADAIDAAGLPPASVTLEVTEAAPASGVGLSTLTRLRMRGFGLSIDDFGTGHSSLERLNQVPFTELKVDRSFVNELATNEWARTIAAQSITLARALGLRSVGEGVEDEAALDWLRGVHCDLAQGYHLGRPVPVAALEAWAAAREGGRTTVPS